MLKSYFSNTFILSHKTPQNCLKELDFLRWRLKRISDKAVIKSNVFLLPSFVISFKLKLEEFCVSASIFLQRKQINEKIMKMVSVGWYFLWFAYSKKVRGLFHSVKLKINSASQKSCYGNLNFKHILVALCIASCAKCLISFVANWQCKCS